MIYTQQERIVLRVILPNAEKSIIVVENVSLVGKATKFRCEISTNKARNM